MSDKPSVNKQQENLAATTQRKKARYLLVLLQWLGISLLLVGLVWLYIAQQRQHTDITQRLQTISQRIDKLNMLEDKLVAMNKDLSNKQVVEDKAPSTQSSGQIQQIRLQLQAADVLLRQSRYLEAIQLLQGIHWQLEQGNHDISAALTAVLLRSLEKDITYLQSRERQPDSWQEQIFAIQAVQKFLASQVSDTSVQKPDIRLYDVIMQLNLAQQAAANQDSVMLQRYLRLSVDRLKSLFPATASATELSSATTSPSKLDNQPVESGSDNSTNNTINHSADKHSTETNDSNELDRIKTLQYGDLQNMSDVVYLLEQMIATPPTAVTLTTTQVLAVPENNQ
ncbi:hypothetical protein [Psychrobacter sp. I-STPA6b]|uniref:hypothetical protein n=1 Tax=Psychrobacter sp. I-STPA6b TaxID=2585718 RepID=UPI001D0C90E9|nr:hypothetical protein [Psychrobacter sp. I-STPA6b]